MKQKGFTLIELLAVIVILAIIALISVPMIINVIGKAKLGALEDSAYGLIDSANLYYSSNIQNGMETTEFTCTETGCVSDDKKLIYKGSIESGKIKIYSDGKVSVCIENGTNAAIKVATDTKVTTAEKGSCNTTGDEYSIDEVVSLTKYNELKKEFEDYKANSSNTNDATATASDILIDKTSYSSGIKLTGTMANNGPLNWNPSESSSLNIVEGYYSGGTISTSNAYSAGYNAGKKSAKITYSISNNEAGYMFYHTPAGVTKIDINYNSKQYVVFNGSYIINGTGSGSTTRTVNPSTGNYFQIAGNGTTVSGTLYFD